MSETAYDLSLLEEKLSGMTRAMLGNGATEGDLQRLLMTETGQFAGRLGDAFGPSSQSVAMAKVDRDIKTQITTLPRFSNLDADQQYSSTAEFTWLSAGPNYLLGINDEDNQMQASGAEALKMLRAGQNSAPRGNAYIVLGKRGKQTVQRLNRIRISPAAYAQLRNLLKDRTGQLRAACYRIASRYVPTKRIPGWIRDKFDDVERNGKSVLDEALLRNGPLAAIEFTIRSPGLESNPKLGEKYEAALKKTEYILGEKLRKILAGYAYDWATGKIFRSRINSLIDFGEN